MHGTIEAGLRVELRGLGDLAAFADDLRALAARACEPNVFYEPAFVSAASPLFGSGVLAGLVWRRGGAPAQLVGFFPVAIERRRYGLTFPVLVGWTHRFAPLGAPLIDRDLGEDVVTAWFDRIAADPDLPKLLLMPLLPVRCAAVFETALASRGGRSAEFAYHLRAMLRPDHGRAGYLDVAIPHKKRKELRRQMKRLADRGLVTSGTAIEPPELGSALDDFFTIEASGWKGRAGTATAGDARLRGFITAAVMALAREGKASVSRLAVDGKPVAAEVTLRSSDGAWGWKIAYDEAFARYSPGVQILLSVTQRLLDDTSIARTDSCATPDHPMIDHVWRERLALSDRLMAITPRSAAAFVGVCALESLRRKAIDGARTIRNSLRRR